MDFPQISTKIPSFRTMKRIFWMKLFKMFCFAAVRYLNPTNITRAMFLAFRLISFAFPFEYDVRSPISIFISLSEILNYHDDGQNSVNQNYHGNNKDEYPPGSPYFPLLSIQSSPIT